MRSFIVKSAVAIATVLALTSPAAAGPCKDLHDPVGDFYAVQENYPNIYLRLRTWDMDRYPLGREMRIYVNDVLVHTEPDGDWEGRIFNGIGRVRTEQRDWTTCGHSLGWRVVRDLNFQ